MRLRVVQQSKEIWSTNKQTNKQTGVEEMLARSAADVRQNKVLLTVNTNL